MTSKFTGKWILMPEDSKYEKGMPPKKANYIFKQANESKVDVGIEWIDSKGKEHEIEYSIYPDGKKKKYEDPQIADEIMSEFSTDSQLITYTYKAGKTIAIATRTILENGTLEVIQQFLPSGNNSYVNIQYYQKQGATIGNRT